MYAAVCRLENEKNANKDYLLMLAEKQHSDFVETGNGDEEKSDSSKSRTNSRENTSGELLNSSAADIKIR